jgi:hypothetical protein
MLTTTEDVLKWFDDFGGAKNPYWVLYASHDKRDAPLRRAMNWHFSDEKKARELLETTLKTFAMMGGSFHLTVSAVAKDSNTAASINIIWGANGQNGTSGAQINGIGYMQSNTEIFRHMQEKHELKIKVAQLEWEQKAATKINGVGGIGGAVIGYLEKLSEHPNFNPNTPFELIGGLFGSLFLNKTYSTAAGLPQNVPVNYGTVAEKETETQPTATEPTEPKKVEFTYIAKDIVQNHIELCDKMGVPFEERNNFSKTLLDRMETLTIEEKLQLSALLTPKTAGNG